MIPLLAAEATNEPVWWLFIATLILAGATGVLAVAAFKALGQLAIAVAQLEEVKKDRHVQVFFDFGVRWDSEAMSETLQRVTNHSPGQVAELVARSQSTSKNPIKKHLRKRANQELAILLREPNYFEDLAIIAQTGSLDLRLVSKDFKGVGLIAWDYWESAIAELRKADEYSYSQFEWLVGQMKGLPDE